MSFSDLPDAPARKHQKAFERAGWVKAGQEGSHIKMKHASIAAVITLVDHGNMRKGTLRAEIRKAQLSDAQYRKLFDEAN